MVIKSPLDEEFLGYDIPEFGYVDPTRKPEFSWVRSPDKKILREKGRRKSPELCVNQVRDAVDAWRDSGYSGSSATTIALFHWWFEPRDVAMFDDYQPYWVQREAIETIVYLLEIKKIKDVSSLIQEYGWRSSTHY